VAGRRTGVLTRISHNERDLKDHLQSQIARQMHLSKKVFMAFVDCSLGGEEYVSLLIRQGTIRL
jgi:hypothetical protein